jgi:hypothetical protein
MGSVPGVKVNSVKLLLAGGSAQGSSVGRSTLTDAFFRSSDGKTSSRLSRFWFAMVRLEQT